MIEPSPLHPLRWWLNALALVAIVCLVVLGRFAPDPVPGTKGAGGGEAPTSRLSSTAARAGATGPGASLAAVAREIRASVREAGALGWVALAVWLVFSLAAGWLLASVIEAPDEGLLAAGAVFAGLSLLSWLSGRGLVGAVLETGALRVFAMVAVVLPPAGALGLSLAPVVLVGAASWPR